MSDSDLERARRRWLGRTVELEGEPGERTVAEVEVNEWGDVDVRSVDALGYPLRYNEAAYRPVEKGKP